MGTDEYDKASGGSSVTLFLIPLMVAIAAIIAAMVASSGADYHGTLDALFGLMEKNQILQAFVASSVLGLVSYTVMTAGRAILSMIRGRTFCSITISNKDENFEKVIDFVGKQGIMQSGCLVASTKKKNMTWKDWREES